MIGADSCFWAEDPLPVPTPQEGKYMLFIGIDPGVSGGIGVVDVNGNAVDVWKLANMTDADIMNALGPLSSYDGVRAVLERVGASPQMGTVSAFTFGKHYGALRMALTAVNIPFDEVTPQRWQQAMSCRSRGDKNVTKRRAQQLFPSRTITHAIADALLMAEYCRRIERGSLQPQTRSRR